MNDRVFTPHATLKSEQRDASNPQDHIWLSASAGTGKTYVLSARVLRLLLRGVKPETILCLTFTKAGAAEMAQRVHERLADWVQIEDAALAADLKALDEDFGREYVARARTLFATVLESRGGGLRIMTIHAFCQTLLAGFPLEAGIAPGFRPLEGREEAALVQSVLADLVIAAERDGDQRLISDLHALSLRMGEREAVAFLTRAARAVEAFDALGQGIGATVRRAMGVPADFSDEDMVAACRDGAFDRQSLIILTEILNDWGTARARERVETISDWLLGTPQQRAAELTPLSRAWCKADGTLFASKGWVPVDMRYDDIVERLDAWCRDLLDRAARAALAADITAALNAGQRYARAYADAKRMRGLVDFDDQIQLTRTLLQEPGMGDWIRYKLDQATDHVLVDESQDTNRAQWDIIDALVEEFWSGDGAKGDTLRTIFSVGDYKQAIYGFQGTDPEQYDRAGISFQLKAEHAGQDMRELSLNESFRSSPPVLDVVDALLEELGPDALGLKAPPHLHKSFKGGPGEVLLLPPVIAEHDGAADGEESWIPDATRDLATRLAKQVKRWISEPMWLASRQRALRPGDVMILVRKRSDIAALLVARLHEEGVAVAGVDRLQLKAPLAVQDLVAAMRFAAQPHDDLTLAALLVSPLIGWSQDDLFAIGYGRAGNLWNAVPAGNARDALGAMLSAADNITPYAFFENLLSGPLQGRKKLLARLGDEARDSIDELLNAALQFEREGVASLQQFIDWFDRGEGEIVRDPAAAGNAVRVMTVHGAKGLQAPVVILADACADPDKARDRNFKWTIDGVVANLPLFRPRTAEGALVASLQTSMDDTDEKARKEHWRLLYVAMTRAEERLVIAGSLSPSAAKRGVPADSWHAAVERAMMRMVATKADDAQWGAVLRHGQAAVASMAALNRSRGDVASIASGLPHAHHPAWLQDAAPQEARPPRPLAPSSIGQDDVANPPQSAAMAAAAVRGRLLHALFERLPALAAEDRREAGSRWLVAAGADKALVDDALVVIDDPRFAQVFAPDALAEAPVAGVVGGIVIAGTVDRFSISDTVVEIVDFKTGRRVPSSVDGVPLAHLRQMAAYAAVLEGIFPDHDVRASLLYTEGPVMYRLPPALVALHKPGFMLAQDNLAAAS